MEVEGYPGLVVHGPYSSQCLLDLARDNSGGRNLKTYAMRARAPLFDTDPFEVVGRPDRGRRRLRTLGGDAGRHNRYGGNRNVPLRTVGVRDAKKEDRACERRRA